jgi:hypothetical protein
VAEAAGRGPEKRRLTVDFAAWLGQTHVSPERFFRDGLIVLDANVLLDLYRITPDARDQVLEAFDRVADRLWVPHQAAIEFSRNRKRVVEDRMSWFKESRQLLRAAAADAVEVLESAVAQLVGLRERTGAMRKWDLDEAALNRESLLARLAGVMDPALAELATLEAEHDLRPKDMQQVDPLLSQIDELLAGRIGSHYSSSELRILVEEAHTFRFPNKIPPGFRDINKGTSLQAAGDFLLWRQTIDKAAEIANSDRLVLLITKELKPDWWHLDAKGRPRGPHPELVQELRDAASADLLLLSLKDFVSGAKTYLSFRVSDQTMEELEEISDNTDALLPDAFRDPSVKPNLLDLDPRAFERLVHYLLIQMGYAVDSSTEGGDHGFDFLLIDERESMMITIIVEAKRYRRPISVTAVDQMLGYLHRTAADSAILITTSSFTDAARSAAQDRPVELIDGATLLRLLAKYGIHATIRFD